MVDMRDSALNLAAQNMRVIPLHWPEFETISGEPICSCGDIMCSSVGKHPLTRNGVKDAQTSPSFIDHWWRQYPKANIGVATGFDFDVIDIDGPEGASAYAELCGEFGTPYWIAMARTGRQGGGHVYTRTGGMTNWTGGFAGMPPHLDCKGVGGYVVAPPSLHWSGRRYEWEHDYNAGVGGYVPWPEWHSAVKAKFTGASAATSGNGGTELLIRQPASSGGRFADVVRDRVISEVRAAGDGSRWQTLAMVGIWACAGLVIGGEITSAEAEELCTELASEIGLSATEIGRVPAELHRAIVKRQHPIQSHGPVSALPGQVAPEGLPDLAAGASAATSTDAETMLVENRAAYERVRLLATEKARESIARDRMGERKFAQAISLAPLLAEANEMVQYRIDGVWPVGARVMLAAQYKAGKTTLVGNIVRCLADSARFLSRYQASAPQGNVTLIDTEMTRGMLRTWFRDQSISTTAKVTVIPMRGHLTGFDITDDLLRAHWAQELKAANSDVVILDCLGPVMAACGLDESVNADVGKFINAFESLLTEAGIAESMIVHHMGHTGERSRGASRLRDWPDVEWHLIREGQEDEYAPAPDVPRFFRAYGRDVTQPEQLLTYEPEFRWLSVGGEGNRTQVRKDRIARDIVKAVITQPGISFRTLQDVVRGKTDTVRATIKELTEAGTLVVVNGPNRTLHHYHSDYQER